MWQKMENKGVLGGAYSALCGKGRQTLYINLLSRMCNTQLKGVSLFYGH